MGSSSASDGLCVSAGAGGGAEAKLPGPLKPAALKERYEVELVSKLPADKYKLTWLEKGSLTTRALVVGYVNEQADSPVSQGQAGRQATRQGHTGTQAILNHSCASAGRSSQELAPSRACRHRSTHSQRTCRSFSIHPYTQLADWHTPSPAAARLIASCWCWCWCGVAEPAWPSAVVPGHGLHGQARTRGGTTGERTSRAASLMQWVRHVGGQLLTTRRFSLNHELLVYHATHQLPHAVRLFLSLLLLTSPVPSSRPCLPVWQWRCCS